MKLSHLRDVLATAELGSLRAASRHLGIAQPAITRSIRELERELGVPLFERHAKGVKLTVLGQAFVRRLEAVDSELRRAREEVAQLAGKTVGEVSVALSTASCMGLLPSALSAFNRRYPNVVLKISEGLFQPLEGDIVNGKIDFWVGPLEPEIPPAQCIVETLFDNRRRVVARKGHALASASSLRELEGAGWIRPTLSTRSTEADFDAMFARLNLPPPKIVIHARSALVTVLAVASTNLLTILPQQWVDFDPLSSLVQALDLIEPMAAAPMCLVRRQGLPLTPMAEHLSDLIRRTALEYGRLAGSASS